MPLGTLADAATTMQAHRPISQSPAQRVHLLALLLAVLTSMVLVGPAHATETGIVPSLKQTVDGPAHASELGVGWVRLFVNWGGIEPSDNVYNAGPVNELRTTTAAYRARGVKVLAVVTGSPQWASGSASGIGPPTDPYKYAEVVAYLMDQAPGVNAWEVWNEADESEFWLGGPQPAAYAALLRATYPVVKARNPNATVVTAGMVGNNFGFLEALYANGAKGNFDAVGVHTDTACLIAAPDSYYREPDGRIGRYAFTGYREVHQVMARHGDGDKPIWMTELGWNTTTTAPNSCQNGVWAGTKPAGVSEAQQAQFLTQAYECMAADPYLAVTMWFSLQDIRDHPGYAAGLGLLRTDGSAKPAYAAMRALRNGANVAPNRSCGSVVDHEPPSVNVARPTDGLRFADRLSVGASAADAPGGTGMKHIELLVDGRHILNFKGDSVRLDPWYNSRDRISLGRHTLTLRAYDNAGNTAERSVTVEKVRPDQLAPIATVTTLGRPRVRGRRVTLSGRFTPAESEQVVSGRVYISVEKRAGRRYRRVALVSAKTPGAYRRTVTLHSRGRYRALTRYKGRTPHLSSRSGYRRFTIR
ncbi:MAG TPA: hypothetical protein VGV40_01105 [Solirubrobacteraceae bacterium]|nr:hypothetical protein [Solirubrobacteraceae bacterium]